VAKVRLNPRIRVLAGSEIALGPGKVDLLEAIQNLNSLAQAAKQLKMSYMRAWTLVNTMNQCFRSPLVQLTRGGKQGGRAELTDSGRRVLELYRRMEAASLTAMQPAWKQLAKELER
jgi:molybdate transport system regulatory protein